MTIKKILIANRGEIALRIMRTAKKNGINTVAVYHQGDKNSLHVEYADESYSLGSGNLADTYLNISKIIGLARQTHADAIHPGYGFLSENHLFAKACLDAGLIFIGPTPEAILLMGNKLKAREFAVSAGLPVVPGYILKDEKNLPSISAQEYPLLVKAAAGGGGKGMRIVYDPKQLPEAINATRREALSYFSDSTVYLEKYLESPRHIEVQVLGDHHGNAIHLFERECSVQRRYQKIIEESPSVTLTPQKRTEICESGVRLAKAIGYSNAGTIEFLVDKHLNYYFLEMNTRIQVEHPVTEMVTGFDLVEEQIRIAEGNPLRIKQEQVKQSGHAIECRIYAEDPANGFLPSPGHIHFYQEPTGKDIRVDGYIRGQATISGFFDPMIAKLAVWSEDRPKAIERTLLALDKFLIHGIRTNIDYLKGVLLDSDYQKNFISTAFCNVKTQEINEKNEVRKKSFNLDPVLIAALLYGYESSYNPNNHNIWYKIGYWRQLMQIPVQCDELVCRIKVKRVGSGDYIFTKGTQIFNCCMHDIHGSALDFSVDGNRYQAIVSFDPKHQLVVRMYGFDYIVKRSDVLTDESVLGDAGQGKDRHDNELTSPMPGKIIDLRVKPGDRVEKGDILAIIESMKMENNILAPFEAEVEGVFIEKGLMVNSAATLIKLKPMD